jgi:trk system potassium uptake protein TrkH
MLLWPVLRLLVLFSGLFSLAMVFPLLSALALREGAMLVPFGAPLAAALAASLAAFVGTKKRKNDLSVNEGILLLCMVWILGGLLGAVPYYLSGFLPRRVDAVFESVSGLTATGATVFPDPEILPRSLLLWRGMTQWLGGAGVLVMTATLAPALGAGGFLMPRVGGTGPMRERFTMKIGGTAKALCLLYLGLTLTLFALLMLGGMTWLDAAAHAFSAMGTGGFSTKSAGIAAWNSPYLEWVCILFMLIAGFNFPLLCRLLQGNCGDLLRNSEARAYAAIVVAAALLVAARLAPHAGSPGRALRLAFFDVASIISTTGFRIDNHNHWPPLAQTVVFMLMLVGGCSGSVAGGVKIIRYVILFKQTKNELLRNLYPRGIFSLQLNGKSVRKDIVFSAGSFFYLYALMVALGTLLVCSAGTGLYDSLNAGLAIVGNIGLGFGKLFERNLFSGAPGYVKWGLSALMLAGRLEIYVFIILFNPAFWKNN